VAGEVMPGHKSRTDWARDRKFLRKIHICVFAVLIFWQFSEKKITLSLHPVELSRSGFWASTTFEEPDNTVF